jgi:hypothetical protein
VNEMFQTMVNRSSIPKTIVFNRMERKLEVIVLMESGSVRVVPNPFLKFIRLQLDKWSKILR